MELLNIQALRGIGWVFFESLKPWNEIKKDCIESLSDEDKANYDFNYFFISSITYIKKKDYLSLFNVK